MWISVWRHLPYEHIRWIANKEEVDVEKYHRNFRHEEGYRSQGKSAASVCKCMECGYDRRQKSGLNINGIQQITLFIYLRGLV